MKKITLAYVWAPLSLLCLVTLGLAAPTPRLGPFDVEGTIMHVQWFPEKFVKAEMMTGTAGHDRVFPAHFLISVTKYSGIDEETLETMKFIFPRFVSPKQDNRGKPEFIVLYLNCEDKTFLKEGMRIKVKEYVLWGDEGGDYPSYKEVQVLSGKEQ
jgi:hypothetical protein